MNDQESSKAYRKYKLRVKIWEKEFRKSLGRIPSKYDIRDAPREIRNAYKMYYKLKTQFLEDTLTDVLSDDGFDISDMCLNDTTTPNEATDSDNLPNNLPNLSDLLTESQTNAMIKQFEAVEDLQLNKKAWDTIKTPVNKLNRHVSTGRSNETEVKSLSAKFTKKLFEGNTSFHKRNPRKALSRVSSMETSSLGENNSLNSDDTNSKDLLPDLETILIEKAKEQSQATAKSNSLLNINTSKKDVIKTDLDPGWLQRTSAQHDLHAIVPLKEHNIDNSNSQQPTKSAYGLSNIDMTKVCITAEQASAQTSSTLSTSKDVKTALSPIETNALLTKESAAINKRIELDDSDAVIDNSDEDAENRDCRHRVKRRRCSSYRANSSMTKAEDDSSLQDDSDSDYNDEVEKPNGKRKRTAFTKTKINKKKPVKLKHGEPDTLAADTDDIAQIKRQSNRSNKKKTKSVITETEAIPPNSDDLKYTLLLDNADMLSMPRVEPDELHRVDSLAKQYINTTLPAPKPQTLTASKPLVLNEKREAARRKLLEKIAAGKLNENYRTINIQKKVFVRGKSNMSYTRYKRKMWKHKKHIAALTGPNMDMGGCDGGILTCFNCGQPGHMAQKCKLKGDALLPLSAELAEDPSEYPTLEEAECMASQAAVAVHSNNLAKLPEAANPAIYKTLYTNEHSNAAEAETVAVADDDDDEGTRDNVDLLVDNDVQLESDSELDSMAMPIKKYVGHKIPEEFMKAAGLIGITERTASSSVLYEPNEDGSVKEVTPEVLQALHLFGHTEFRKGQDRAIMRILSGMSTLVTLSTGSGKSLCYQLPAYLYARQRKCITLVISPLVSLMEDQVTGIPHFLRAYCLHTNQTQLQKLKIMEIIKNGEIDVLLLSPEAVVAGEHSNGFGSILRQLPPIAFACIDEAHCVSQWSHNFRPSYLMICKVLRKGLGVKCVLGLTATATLSTRSSIIKHLGITDGEKGIISDTPLPDNLILSVSKDCNRDDALLQLLLSKRFETCHSIIVYCTRRTECERIATYLRTCFQNYKTLEEENSTANGRRRKRINWYAEAYHAGLPASRRRSIQNAFMSNELRIVVATVAFGMGINKPDIRAIIHYNMPRNFESYVQEIGRAGRDNQISHCHLFLDANGDDQNELRRHIYANSIDRHVIRKLLQNIFIECSCAKRKANAQQTDSNGCKHLCSGHEIAFSIEKTVSLLDIPQENIFTLLCYMELDDRWDFNILSNAYIKAKVISYAGAQLLKHAAKECPPLAMAIALAIKNQTFNETDNTIEFSVVDVAAAIGWNSGVVKHQLKNLEWTKVNGYPKRSSISVNFYDLGFRLKAPGDFATEQIDEALNTLYQRAVQQEQTQLIQYVFQGLSSVAYKTCMSCCKANFRCDRSDQLKAIIRNYFQNDYPKELKLEIFPSMLSDEEIVNDVNGLLNMYPENNFSGRNVARIFHGISSPNYPAVIWHRCKYWRLHFKTDFNRIVRLANMAIVKRRI